MADDVRLPLVSGRTSWQDRVRFSAGLIPLAAILCFVVTVWMPMFDGLASIPLIGKFFAILEFMPLIVAILLIVVAFKSRDHALATRPSDLVVGKDRITIRGGTLDGTVVEHDELATLSLVETKREDRGFIEGMRDIFTDRQAMESVLELRTTKLLLAEAVSADEQRTLRAVHRMLADLAAPPAAVKPAADAKAREVEELLCGHCGAPVSPDDRDTVTCPACQTAVTVPAALRDRVRAGRLATEVSSLRVRAITDMTSLPDAVASSRLLRVLGWVMIGAWPVLLITPLIAHLGLDLSIVAVVLLVGIGLDIALYFAMLPRFVVRQAFPITLHEFAARAGDHDQPLCRQCSAPLPPSSSTVVRCAFCNTDNLLGRELVRALPALRSEAGGLEPAAAAWRSDRRRTRVVASIASVILLGAIGTTVAMLPGARRAGLTAECLQMDTQACRTLGRDSYRAVLEPRCFGATADPYACETLSHVEPDRERAVRAARHECELESSSSCIGADLTCSDWPDLASCDYFRARCKQDPQRADCYKLRGSE